MTPRWTRFVLLFLVLSVTTHCGAKTPLYDPDNDAGTTLSDACVPGSFQLLRRSVEALLVLDRSGSMSQRLGNGITRWDALRNGLNTALPPFHGHLTMGAMLFPNTAAGSCGVPDRPDVMPEPGSVRRILDVLQHTTPSGGTPTAAAIRNATRFLFSRRTGRLQSQAIVLATDGEPSCNTNGSSSPIDDAVHAIAEALRNGIPTYVIGIDRAAGDFHSSLSRMAAAGGRPNPNGARAGYYSIHRPEDVTEVFVAIQRSLALCTLLTPSRPDDPDGISITLNGTPIPRDLTHRDGWDWTDRDAGEITLFGPACDTASRTAVTPMVQVSCRDGG